MLICAKTVVTGDSETVIKDGAVLFENGVIKEVGPAEQLKCRYPGENVRDYGDATILPGLIDMHVHMGYWYNRPDKQVYGKYLVAYMALDYAQRAIKAGVTTMRDVMSPDGVCREYNIAVSKGFLKHVPRLHFCNRAICATGGHAWNTLDGSIEVDGEWEIRKAIRTQIREGADWIKVMASHRSDVSELTQQEMDAAVDETRRHNRRIAVHSSRQPSLQICINAGVDTIEHGTDLTYEQVLQMKEKGIAWSPTLLVHKSTGDRLDAIVKEHGYESLTPLQKETYDIYRPANIYYRANFKKFAETGVLVVSGTDMISEGAAAAPVAQELAVMVEYGMSPVWAIGAGTKNCAKALGMEGKIGELIPGALADITVVSGDASEDIGCLENVKEVLLGGETAYSACE
ncbi:MAG: amidohydrolase family protein [Bacillota bacterium]|jgi:imidazolonepropionase-like amidohydrolase